MITVYSDVSHCALYRWTRNIVAKYFDKLHKTLNLVRATVMKLHKTHKTTTFSVYYLRCDQNSNIY